MTRVFISYSHADEGLRAELEKHLAVLKREGATIIWSDHCIQPGDKIDGSINRSLEDASIVLLLVSANFLASKYCIEVEMKRAMERNANGDCTVVPVILKSCDWQRTDLGKLKAVPNGGKPVTKWEDHDDAYLDVVEHLRGLISKPGGQQPSGLGASLPVSNLEAVRPPSTERARIPRSNNLALPREFSDQDKYEFTQATFNFIREYFDRTLEALEQQHPQVKYHLKELSPRAFTAIVFRNGKRVAGCRIGIDGGFGGGIGYVNDENASPNTFNEHLYIQADKQTLYLKATMGLHLASAEGKLDQRDAAEHLWSMFFTPVQ